jgi:alkyldihydroxyacetonephosphate synthase
MTAFRWGEPAQAMTLPPEIRTILGLTSDNPPSVPITLPAARALPFPNADVSDEARLGHAAGMSTEDLLLARSGQVPGVPDGVIRPESHDEILETLRIASEYRVAVVPYGGGTSVVGGLHAERNGFAGVIALDLARMNRLVDIDPISRTATFEAGIRGPEAEKVLASHGFTLGHFPQSFQYATLGGFAATRSSGQASSAYGRFDQMVVALRAATPTGSLDLGRAPQSAAGPDLRQLLLGSEGIFGVITQLTVRVRPASVLRYAGWRFPSFADGLRAMRSMAQDGPLPAVARLSDEVESQVSGVEGALAILSSPDLAGPEADVPGATPLGAAAGDAWQAGRYGAGYLRDALLDAGGWADTFETAIFWNKVPDAYATIRDALREAAPHGVVMCHVSHVYETGASLYYTLATKSDDDPVAQWRAVKKAAGDAVAATGGTITHHHGVGRDHRPWYAGEIGPVGAAMLRGAKQAADPAGILNPGILLP